MAAPLSGSLKCRLCERPHKTTLCIECRKVLEKSIGGHRVRTLLARTADCHFMLELALETAHHERATLLFQPFPLFLEAQDFPTLRAHLRQLLQNWPEISQQYEVCPNDEVLSHYLGEELFWTLKFVLLPLPRIIWSQGQNYLLELPHRPVTKWLFHGSDRENLFSILRLGLLKGSDTILEKHGHSYGPGIYLSDFSGACTYARNLMVVVSARETVRTGKIEVAQQADLQIAYLLVGDLPKLYAVWCKKLNSKD